MAQVEETIQIKDALNVLDEVFDNLEDLVFNVSEKIRHNANAPNLYSFIDSLYNAFNTTKRIVEYIMDNIQPTDIYATLDFYRSWLMYAQRLLYTAMKEPKLVSEIMETVDFITASIYKSFREFKKQNDNRQNKIENVVINPNTPIPTREL